jgi:hypothetical protein
MILNDWLSHDRGIHSPQCLLLPLSERGKRIRRLQTEEKVKNSGGSVRIRMPADVLLIAGLRASFPISDGCLSVQ